MSPVNNSADPFPPVSLFDNERYLAINDARWAVALDTIEWLRQRATLETAYDLGCGPGWFAQRLADQALNVIGLEARADVLDVARHRAPKADFVQFDFDAAAMGSLPAPRDFVLCFGILYHLENPLRALRIARALTARAILLETMTFPSPEPVARLARENDNVTQGVRELSLILSPLALEQALWASGFSNVCKRVDPVDHEDFLDTDNRYRRRHVYFASLTDEDAPPGFASIEIKEPKRADYWKRA